MNSFTDVCKSKKSANDGMNKRWTYLALDFLAMFVLLWIIVVALKVVFPDLGVWILIMVGGFIGIVYPRVVRHLRQVREP